MINPLPDYKNLDLSGDARQAAARMEARAQETASAEMFRQLVAPLLTAQVKTVLEFGCGTAALSRRVARFASWVEVYASDKSEGMLQIARRLSDSENIHNIHLQNWDVLEEANYSLPVSRFDLIISSVVIPYFDDLQTADVIKRLSMRLAPGGVLAFVEQDLATDTVYFPETDWFRAVLTKDLRNLKRTLALGLRPLLRDAGLQVLPRRSFLWTDDTYGAYTKDLLERFANAACEKSRITPVERDEWKKTLTELAESGDFYYGIVYHCVAGKQAK